MTTLTKQSVAALQKDMDAALKPVMEKYGLKLQKNRGRYDSYSVKISLELVIGGPEAEAELQRARFGFMFKDYGVDFGTVVTDNKGIEYTVHGFKKNGKLEARSKKDGRIWHAEPKFFRLNGVPLKAEWEKAIEKRAAEKGSIVGAEQLGGKGA